MRNLKRALSLAMASIMILGMMVIGAGAVSYDDFSDKDKIVNKEAVNTMVSLGVINGKEDGSYDPTGIVTRAEMAKLIAVMLTGGKDPTLGNITSNFSDTKGNWADAYIAYCANKGIINGRGDGTFGPNEAVNGTAAAKMLLTALGYRSDIEKLTGIEWEINTNVLANKVNLFNGIEDILPQEGLSRDNTAQMVYNAVQAQEVEYKNNYGEYSGVIYAQPNGTILKNRFKVIKVEGVVAANDVFSVDGAPVAKGRTRIIDANTDINANIDQKEKYDGTYTVAVPNDMVGKRIIIYVKFLNDLAPNASSATVVGSAILSEQNVVVETNSKLKTADKVKDALKGSSIAVADTSGTGANAFAGTKEVLVTEGKTVTSTAGANAGIQTVPGVHQTFIDNNNDGKVDYVIQVKAALSKVTVYNTTDKKLTLSGLKSIDFSDIANPEDVAKDDYVLVAKYDDTYYLTKATSVTGDVTAYSSGDVTVTVEGTTYAKGAGKCLASDLETALDGDTMSTMVNGSYTLYLDAYNNVLGYVEGDTAVGSYAVVTAATNTGATGFESGKVKLLMSDGTTGTYEVDLLASAKKWSSEVNTGSNATKESNMAKMLTTTLVGTVVSYSVSGSTVTIGQPAYTNSKTYYSFSDTSKQTLKNSTSSYTVKGTNVMADNSTVFFIKDVKGNLTAVAGLSKLPASALTTVGAVNVIAYKSATNSTYTARAVYAQVNETFTSNKDYVYVSDTYTKTKDGNDTIYTYPVVFEDGKTGTLKSKTDDTLADANVYEYQVDASGYATFDKTSDRTINGKTITSTGKGTIAVIDTDKTTGVNSYPVLSKASIWNVEDTKNIFDSTMATTNEVCLVLDSDGNVRTAFVTDTEGTTATVAPAINAAVNAGQGVYNNATGNLTWTGVSADDALGFSFKLGDKQTAKLSVSADSAAKGKVTADATFAAGSEADKHVVYKAGASENGGKVTVTIVFSEEGKADTTVKRETTVYGGATVIAAPNTVKVAEPGTSAAVITNSPAALDEINAASATTRDIEVSYTNSNNKLFIDVTPATTASTVFGGTVKSVTLTDEKGNITTTNSKNEFNLPMDDGVYTVKVTMKLDNAPDATFTYKMNLKVTNANPLASAELDMANATNTEKIVYALPQAIKPDQTAALKTGKIADGLFNGYAPVSGVKTTYMQIEIPFTADQYAASMATDKGLAIRQTNGALTDAFWSGKGNINQSTGVKDKLYHFSNWTEGSDFVLNSDGSGYVIITFLVTPDSVSKNDGLIKFDVLYGADDTTNANGIDQSNTGILNIELDVKNVSFS